MDPLEDLGGLARLCRRHLCGWLSLVLLVLHGDHLTYALVEMRLATTKSIVKDFDPGEGELGYRNAFRWLTDLRTLFAQHFIYLARVKGTDTSVKIPPASPDNEYPTPHEIDLMEIDLRAMVEFFESSVIMTPQFRALCEFEGEVVE